MDSLTAIILIVICGANFALNIIGYLNTRRTEEALNNALDELSKEIEKE